MDKQKRGQISLCSSAANKKPRKNKICRTRLTQILKFEYNCVKTAWVPKANLPAAKKSRRVKIRLKREVRAAEIFLERRFGKAILLIAIEQFSEYSVGLAGSIMAANIGKSAVSAVSLVEFVMALFISVFAEVATGGAVIAGSIWAQSKPATPETP